MHLLVVLSLIVASFFAAVAPAGASPAPQGISAAPHAADSVLVKFKLGTSAAEKANAHAAVGGQMLKEYSLVPGLEHLRIPADSVGVERVLQILPRLPFVEYAEPNYLVHTMASPNDPYFTNGSLWGMNKINAPAAWDRTTGGVSFVVADIDTGIDYNHPDLKANVWPGLGYNFVNNTSNPYDDNGHGTHTAGTIGAVGNNGVGVVGVNWHVKIMALKFLDRRGSGTYADAISALEFAVERDVKVSNNSYGGGYSQAMCDAIAHAPDHLFIAAAGNDGTNNDTTPFSPASCSSSNIIAVAATDRYDALASFSNYGLSTVDLAAPGVDILSTLPKNSYASSSGTSMATPHVAGTAALIWSIHPTWTAAEVRDQILNNVRKVGWLSGKLSTGGILDAAAAVGAPAPTLPAAPTNLTATAVSSSQINLAWTDKSSNESGFKVERLEGSAWTQIATPTDPRYSSTGLAASTPYSYRVRAYNAGGDSAYSNTASATTQAAPAVPSAPSNLKATVVSRSQINLTWTDISNNETGFKIERCTGAGCSIFSQIDMVGAGVTSYQNTGLSSKTQYRYRVRAYNAAGNSAYSNVVSAKTR